MARKSRQSFLKRQRELKRLEKAALKRKKRFERGKPTSPEDEAGLEAPEGDAADGSPADAGTDGDDAEDANEDRAADAATAGAATAGAVRADRREPGPDPP